MLGGKSDVQGLRDVNIFPGVSRSYENKLGKGFMLGLYHAKLAATYGSKNTPLMAETSFFVFPWRIFLFLVLLVMAIAVGYYYWKRKGNTPPSQPSA